YSGCAFARFYREVTAFFRFMEFWRNDRMHKDESHGSVGTWPNDRKYGWAVDGFRPGLENPVPLAYVSAGYDNIGNPESTWLAKKPCIQRPYITFTDGITRTMWLLVNQAVIFPIQTRVSNANLIYKLAGVDAYPPWTIQSFFEDVG
ncbi:MAG: hypothetical protein QM533_04985, partial [Cytophagales bacterium]|nr:hypothetical protein [Cytophagales bacterium]